MRKTVLALCKEGSESWKVAFNNKDAAGCAQQYTKDSVMTAKPIGVFEGIEDIQTCWQNIIDQGFANVEYTNIKWETAGDNGYILSSQWTMNKAFGVVHREHWAIDHDGKARMISDEFEILGER
ncbi:isochorismatase [Pseudoalteromonas aliena]|uniref:isochorismatase n=1 Tax=Pseudoalteromonas aliena TaxID=247523 RepID=UPI0024942C47|nr:isochorismatase [Pseudoalteromonas aliena]